MAVELLRTLRWRSLCLAGCLLLPPALLAQALPPAVEAAIAARLLAADRSLGSRCGESLRIGLLFRSGSAGSANLAALEAYRGLAGQPIQGFTAHSMGRAYRDRADLEAWLEREGIDVLRVGEGLAADLAEVRGVCEARKLVCLTPVPDFVAKGLALGITARDNKPHILVNQIGLKAEGIDLDPKVVELAEVVG